MVIKLLKHELHALFRVLVFVAAAVVVFALLSRVFVTVSFRPQSDSSETSLWMALATALAIGFYCAAMCSIVVVAWALGVSRFYKTLFTGEGYMTLSLPATPAQLLWAKLLSSIIAVLFAVAVSGLSLFLFIVGLDGTLLGFSRFELLEYLRSLWEYVARDPLAFAEEIVEYIVALPLSFLVAYSVICVGQLCNSHRKAVMLLVAFGVLLVASFAETSPNAWLYGILGPVRANHLLLWLSILFAATADVGCFYFIRYILKNKVNLIA